MFCRIVAEYTLQRAGREIDGDVAPCGAHLPSEAAADETDHQIGVEREREKIDVLVARLLAENVFKRLEPETLTIEQQGNFRKHRHRHVGDRRLLPVRQCRIEINSSSPQNSG